MFHLDNKTMTKDEFLILNLMMTGKNVDSQEAPERTVNVVVLALSIEFMKTGTNVDSQRIPRWKAPDQGVTHFPYVIGLDSSKMWRTAAISKICLKRRSGATFTVLTAAMRDLPNV